MTEGDSVFFVCFGKYKENGRNVKREKQPNTKSTLGKYLQFSSGSFPHNINNVVKKTLSNHCGSQAV
jgi:hypothetical protein